MKRKQYLYYLGQVFQEDYYKCIVGNNFIAVQIGHDYFCQLKKSTFIKCVTFLSAKTLNSLGTFSFTVDMFLDGAQQPTTGIWPVSFQCGKEKRNFGKRHLRREPFIKVPKEIYSHCEIDMTSIFLNEVFKLIFKLSTEKGEL